MIAHPPARHLLRAKDLIDARYREPLDVPSLAARRAPLTRALQPRVPQGVRRDATQYLLTRRLERAAALLRNTDRTVSEICFMVGLQSVGSFTSSFGRAHGCSPLAYRAAYPPATDQVRIPTCMLLAYGRPSRAVLEKTPG